MSLPNQGRSPVFRGPMKAVAQGRWVYIRNGGDGREELFDVLADPTQTRDLASQPSARSVLEQLREELAQLLEPQG